MDKMPRRRKRRKRQRRFAFMAGFTVLMLAAFATLSMTVFFNIRTFSLDGDVCYDLDTVMEHSGLSLGDNLFRMNKFDIQRRLVRDLPYIKTAELRRDFPEGLCFILTPAKEEALLAVEDGYAVIDASSKCLRYTDDRDYAPSLPVILKAAVTKTEPGQTVVYEGARTADNLSLMFSLFHEHGYGGKVLSLDMGKSYDMVFMYEGRVECHIGTIDHLDSKLRVIREIISRYPEGEKAVIDAQDYTTVRYKKKNE